MDMDTDHHFCIRGQTRIRIRGIRTRGGGFGSPIFARFLRIIVFFLPFFKILFELYLLLIITHYPFMFK